MTRIAFLVPTFNRAQLLAEALHAICGQVRADDEVLVIDDGSTDSTAEVAAAAPKVRYLRQKNAGKSAALNRALCETDAEFIWICDDDDVLLPGAVQQLAGAAASVRKPVVFGRYRRARQYNGHWTKISAGYWPDLSGGSILRHLLEDHFIMHNASLVRRQAYVDIGGFNQNLVRSVDYEAFIRLALSFEIKFVDAEIYEQREHAGMRGTCRLQINAADATDYWISADETIFRDLHRRVPLSVFESMFTASSPDLSRRAALLERGVVMARHGCWSLACADFETAEAISCELLDAGERRVLRRALCGKYGLGGMTEPEVLDRLQALARRRSVGRQIIASLLRGGLWRLRGGADGRTRREMFRVILSLAGARLPLLSLQAVTPRKDFGSLVENRDLPKSAYVGAGTVPPMGASGRLSQSGAI